MTDLDPSVDSAYRKLSGALDRLATVRIQSEKARMDWDLRMQVDDRFMQKVADDPGSSKALKEYSQRVATGECTWSEITVKLGALPPEVMQIMNDPGYRWYQQIIPARSSEWEEDSEEPYRFEWNKGW
ncbi:hypothetical protein G4H71_01740 [Rhodococcus triatomae]|uniref:hypothetical protein n=1 Tax=Rhodococcus triatomae TaxID=300028 RepID=UPI00111405D4|nr:hypothetical protein [Rhodococcus triatomae]QNG18388.1 hypothetical protein G4H72_06310 [Rhodococcus triatomae]QNG21942.1 hypothetical protein G4H71_01740 [Rhodococcus triatomae]